MMKVYKNGRMQQLIWSTYEELLKQWNVEIEQQSIETRYGTTHVNVFGKEDGEPLVLFHGVGDDAAQMWVYNAKGLGDKFRCYAVDTIGGPGKSIPGPEYNKEYDDVIWIDEILNVLGLTQVHMAGVSHGGYLTQLYTMSRPIRVRRAVSLAASVPASTGGSPMLTMMKVFLPEALFPNDKNIVRLIKKMTGENYAAFTENTLVLEHFKYLMKGFNRKAMLNHKVKGFSNEQIDIVKEKCLYLIGGKDPFLTLKARELLNEYKVNVTIIQEAGHGINHEYPERVNQLISNHLLDLNTK